MELNNCPRPPDLHVYGRPTLTCRSAPVRRKVYGAGRRRNRMDRALGYEVGEGRRGKKRVHKECVNRVEEEREREKKINNHLNNPEFL